MLPNYLPDRDAGKFHSDLKRMETEWSVIRDQEMPSVHTRGLGEACVSCSQVHTAYVCVSLRVCVGVS